MGGACTIYRHVSLPCCTFGVLFVHTCNSGKHRTPFQMLARQCFMQASCVARGHARTAHSPAMLCLLVADLTHSCDACLASAGHSLQWGGGSVFWLGQHLPVLPLCVARLGPCKSSVCLILCYQGVRQQSGSKCCLAALSCRNAAYHQLMLRWCRCTQHWQSDRVGRQSGSEAGLTPAGATGVPCVAQCAAHFNLDGLADRHVYGYRQSSLHMAEQC